MPYGDLPCMLPDDDFMLALCEVMILVGIMVVVRVVSALEVGPTGGVAVEAELCTG